MLCLQSFKNIIATLSTEAYSSTGTWQKKQHQIYTWENLVLQRIATGRTNVQRQREPLIV